MNSGDNKITTPVGIETKNETVNINPLKVTEWLLYVIGGVCLAIGFYYYSNDVNYNNTPCDFYQQQYVGGDAYNLIITASRSTAIMVKSLIWIVLGCSSIIVGRTINNKQCK